MFTYFCVHTLRYIHIFIYIHLYKQTIKGTTVTQWTPCAHMLITRLSCKKVFGNTQTHITPRQHPNDMPSQGFSYFCFCVPVHPALTFKSHSLCQPPGTTEGIKVICLNQKSTHNYHVTTQPVNFHHRKTGNHWATSRGDVGGRIH